MALTPVVVPPGPLRRLLNGEIVGEPELQYLPLLVGQLGQQPVDVLPVGHLVLVARAGTGQIVEGRPVLQLDGPSRPVLVDHPVAGGSIEVGPDLGRVVERQPVEPVQKVGDRGVGHPTGVDGALGRGERGQLRQVLGRQPVAGPLLARPMRPRRDRRCCSPNVDRHAGPRGSRQTSWPTAPRIRQHPRVPHPCDPGRGRPTSPTLRGSLGFGEERRPPHGPEQYFTGGRPSPRPVCGVAPPLGTAAARHRPPAAATLTADTPGNLGTDGRMCRPHLDHDCHLRPAPVSASGSSHRG